MHRVSFIGIRTILHKVLFRYRLTIRGTLQWYHLTNKRNFTSNFVERRDTKGLLDRREISASKSFDPQDQV